MSAGLNVPDGLPCKLGTDGRGRPLQISSDWFHSSLLQAFLRFSAELAVSGDL